MNTATAPRLLAVNLAGVVETPTLGSTPYAVGIDGRPYVPVGDGGVVLGVGLGDGAFAHEADHAAPGVTVVHPDPAARHALTSFACAGNEVVVRTGAAAGARGRVLGKRGELGRVIAVFSPDILGVLVPGDALTVRGFGQGAVLAGPAGAAGGRLVNVDPALLAPLGITTGPRLRVPVRATVPSKLVGNGLGRPAPQWDLDLSIGAATAARWGLDGLRLGDLVAISDLDVRHNAGYRQGWTTVGITVHGGSPLPGHGPGVMPILCAPTGVIDLEIDAVAHPGVRPDHLGFGRG